MASPLSLRLDDHLRSALEQEAQAQGVALSHLIRTFLEQGARDARRARIRRDSHNVAQYIAQEPSAQELMHDVGGAHSHGA